MPLVNEPTNNPFVQAPTPPPYNASITTPTYKHAVVASHVTPINALIVQVEGIPAIVDYYSQVIGEHDEIHHYNPTYNGVQQQYQLIKRLEIKLQGGLQDSFDNTQNRATITGTALLYPGLKPNVGDVFILDIGDGRAGLFAVSEVAQKSIYKNSTYEINFMLKTILTEELVDNLNVNIVETSHYRRDFLITGQNPIITDTAYNLSVTFEDQVKEVLGSWILEFYSHEVNTVIVPNGMGIVFDPFVTNLIVNAFGTHGHPLLANIDQYNTGNNVLSGYTDIWSALLRGERYILEACFKKYQLIPVISFSQNVFLRPIKYSGITHVVMPSISGNSSNDVLDVLGSDTGLAFTDSGTITQEELDERLELNIGAPTMNNNNGYVLSSNIYSLDATGSTGIEQQVVNYFKDLPVDYTVISSYVNNRNLLTPLERFYLMPICLLMLIHSLRSL